VAPRVCGQKFSDIYAKKTGVSIEIEMRQRTFRLERVEIGLDGAGVLTVVGEKVLEWCVAFQVEAMGKSEREMDSKQESRGHDSFKKGNVFLLNGNNILVSMAHVTRGTAHGKAIGFVPILDVDMYSFKKVP